ncbi:MAG: hypothetical protein RRY12_12850, partial [Cloacibacillus sp.]
VQKNKNPKLTVDIMTLIGTESVNVRLRDDGPKFEIESEEGGRITHFSVMGYNDTFIRIKKADDSAMR